MRKKLMALAMCLGLGAALLTGCGKPTVESLIDGMTENQPDSQSGDMSFDFVLNLESEGYGMEVSVGADMEYQVEGNIAEGDSATMYMDGDITVGVFGMSQKLPFEGYMVMEDDETTIYTYDSDSDTWYYSTSDSSDSDSLDSLMDPDMIEKMADAMADAIKENGELAEDTEKVAGVECYVITSTLTGDDMADIYKPFDSVFQDMMEEAGLDDYNIKLSSYMEYFTMDITYYISKEDGWLVKGVVDMSDSDVYGMVEALMKDLDYAEGMDGIDDISFKKCSVTVTITDQNDTEVEVPRDVKNNAVEGSPVDLDDIYGITGGNSDPGWDDDYPGWDDEGDDWSWDDDDDDWSWDDDDDWSWDDNDTNASDYYHDGYVTLNKYSDSSALLCEIHVPDGFVYDKDYSEPENGHFYLNYNNDVYTYITVINNAVDYYGYLYDFLEGIEDAATYSFSGTVIGKAFGTDCYLISEVDPDCYYLVVEYNDGGKTGYLVADFENMMDVVGNWSESDFLTIAQDMFGR